MMGGVLDHLWQSTLLALGVALLTLAFRKAGPAVRHGLWFAASAKFLVPFAAFAALGRWLGPISRPPVEAAPDAVFIARATEPFSQSYASAPVTHAAVPVAHVAASIDPSLLLLVAWALGCGAVLVAWMVRWARVRSAVRGATPLAWPAPMPVLTSTSILEPGLVGLWRPVLIVPRTLFDHLAQPEIDAIVAHETCHLPRRDNLTAAIHMLVEALFWFHPLVWWIGARLIEERERACDEAVVRSGHDRAAYARGLVESCRLYLQSPLPCVAGASGSNLKTRVERIMTAPLSMPLPLSRKTLLVAAGFCAIASPVAAGWLTSPAAQTAVAHATAIVSGFGPARPEGAAPTSVATSAPADGGPMKTIEPAQDAATAASAADTAPAPASSASDAAPQAQPVQETTADGAAPAPAPTLQAALEPAVAARAASRTPGGETEAAVPGRLASMQARQTSNEETSPDQWRPVPGPLGPGPYLQVSGMMKGGDWGAWSPWYAITTPPIAEGHSIRDFHFALRGDRHCGKYPEDAQAECKLTTDEPDKKTVMFRVLGVRCDPPVTVYDNGGGGALNPPNLRGGGSPRFAPAALVCPQIQAEMVISYNVQ